MMMLLMNLLRTILCEYDANVMMMLLLNLLRTVPCEYDANVV